jgi:hypothetical protein
MHLLALLLKTYAGDQSLAERLLQSFNDHNPDGLHLFVVVPEADVKLFESWASPTITVLPESLLAHNLIDHEVAGIRPGYINQEIVKLSFWELGLASNYFCIDSDALIVRDLHRSDFMFDEETPFTVLAEDNELKVEPQYYAEHWQGREVQLRKIQKAVGLSPRPILTCHGHQIFSAKVLASLKTDFMEPKGWSYSDLLEQAPYEFTWYAMWLQASNAIPIHLREPLVKVFHNAGQHLEYAIRGVTATDLARGYIAVVLNSNFSRDSNGAQPFETTAATLARNVGLGALASATVRRLTLPMTRLVGGRNR